MGKQKRWRQFILLYSVIFVLSSCAVSEVETPSPEPAPSGAEESLAADARPSAVSTPEVFMLAGRELSHVLRMDDSQYGFSTEQDAKLEELFAACGFLAEEPFYTYQNEEGWADLTLWYNDKTGIGIGICGDRGFAFTASQASRGDEYEELVGFGWYRWEDDLIPPTPEWLGAENYQEEKEYDEDGRLIKLDSSGEFEEWDGERLWIYSLEWTYDENGVVRYRCFGRNGMFFSSTTPGQNGYYDEMGRLVYERGYITHGHTETYYIYEGENTTPAYCLHLDFSAPFYFPVFVYY